MRKYQILNEGSATESESKEGGWFRKKAPVQEKTYQIHGNSQSIIYLYDFAIVILKAEIM